MLSHEKKETFKDRWGQGHYVRLSLVEQVVRGYCANHGIEFV